MISILLIGFFAIVATTGSKGDTYFSIACIVVFLISSYFEIKFEKKLLAHYKKIAEIKDLEREVKKAELQKKLTDLQNQ